VAKKPIQRPGDDPDHEGDFWGEDAPDSPGPAKGPSSRPERPSRVPPRVPPRSPDPPPPTPPGARRPLNEMDDEPDAWAPPSRGRAVGKPPSHRPLDEPSPAAPAGPEQRGRTAPGWTPGDEVESAEDEGSFWGQRAETAKVSARRRPADDKAPKPTRRSRVPGPGDGDDEDDGWSARPAPRTRRWTWKGVLLWSAGIAAALLLLAWLLVPPIAGAMAPGIIERALHANFRGPFRVEGVSIGWGRSMRVDRLRVGEGRTAVADLKVEAQIGLWSLIRGRLDVGEAVLSGQVRIGIDADGQTNIARAFAPPAPAAGVVARTSAPGRATPPAIPASLRGSLRLDGVRIEYTDARPGRADALLRDLRGKVVFEPGAKLTIGLRGDLVDRSAGASPDRAAAAQGIAAGSFDLDAGITDWSRPDGRLTPERAAGTAVVTLKELSAEVVDRLLGPERRVSAVMGSVVSGSCQVETDQSRHTLSLKLAGERTRVDLGVRAALGGSAGELELTRPGSLEVSPEGLRELACVSGWPAPGDDRLLFDTWPGVQAAFEGGRLPLTADAGRGVGIRPDLRGAGLTVSVRLSEAAGRVRLPEAGGAAGLGAPDQVMGPPRRFTLSAFTARLDAPDLAGTIRLSAAGQASIDEQPAGSFRADLTGSRLLLPDGSVRATGPAALDGVLAVRQFTTALLQPLGDALGVDLVEAIGPMLELELSARAADGGTSELRARFTADNIQGVGDFLLDAGVVSSRGATLSVRSLGGLVPGLLPGDLPVRVMPGGAGEVVLTRLVLPTGEGGSVLARAVVEARATITGAGVRVRPGLAPFPADGSTSADAIAIEAREITLAAALDGGRRADLSLGLRARQPAGPSHSGPTAAEAPVFEATLSADVARLLTTGTADTGSAGPAGRGAWSNIPLRVTLSDLPLELVERLAPPMAPPVTDGPRPVELARSLLGPAISGQLRARLTDAPNLPGELGADLHGSLGRLELDATQLPTAVGVRSARLTTTMSPDLLDRLRPLLRGTPIADARITTPAQVALAVGDLQLSLGDDGAPLLSGAELVRAALEIPGTLMVEGLDAAGPAPSALGRVGVSGLKARGTAPLSILGLGTLGAQGDADIDLDTAVLAEHASMGRLAVTARASRGAGGWSIVSADLRGTDLDVAELSARLGLGDAVSGAVGARASGTASITPPDAQGQRRLDLALDAERARVSRLTARLGPEVLVVSSPFTVEWSPDAGWLGRVLRPAPPPGQSPQRGRELIVEQVGRLDLTVTRLVVGLDGVPLRPDRAAFEGSARLSSLRVRSGTDGVTDLVNPRASLRSNGPGAFVFELGVESATLPGGGGGSGAGGGTQRMTDAVLTGSVASLIDQEGRLRPEQAEFTLRGSLPGVPVGFIDALAGQGGLLEDALGPMLAAEIAEFSRAPGRVKLSVKAEAERAAGVLAGTGDAGVFVAEGTPEITVRQVTPEMSRRLAQAAPVIESVSKTPLDEPAVIRASGLRVPTAGNMAALNGRVDVNFGTTTIVLAKHLTGFLQAADVEQAAKIPQRLDPFTVVFTNGVASFDRWKLPVGRFLFSVEGRVDLVQRTVDLTTIVPALAVTDSLLARVNLGGRVPEEVAIRFRTRGPIDHPTTEPDLTSVVTDIARDLIRRGAQDQIQRQLPTPRLPGTTPATPGGAPATPPGSPAPPGVP
jgi:hypothetical protein